ncbi:MAG: hypothetical protein KAI29_16925 [Cyclobacteriaceae bacterium]|nr:hypothetical protein [Cyclobacteriaceae bacterium]
MKKLIIATAFILLAGTAFSQTLQKGAHLGIQSLNVTLDPDVTMNQYLDFTLNTFIPEAEKHFPGMKGFVIGGGMEIGSEEVKVEYSLIWYWESVEDFNNYFDAEGNPTDAFLATFEKLGPTIEKLEKLGISSAPVLGWLIL